MGRLREDFSPEDLVVLLMANAGVIAATIDDAPGAWRRFVALMTQSFEAPARGSLPEVPRPAELYCGMIRLGRGTPRLRSGEPVA